MDAKRPAAMAEAGRLIFSNLKPRPDVHLRMQTPGSAPFLRGARATMYANQPWSIRQYSGFATAEESNAFFRRNLAAGQTGLSIAFDLPIQRGYDSDDPRVAEDVGKTGVAIDTVEDMKVLFDGIPLARTSVSMTMNGAVLPVFAAFIVAARESGVSSRELSGTIQNDILKEFLVRNTYVYPPQPSMRIVSDVIGHVSREMPRFNAISISGYHMHEAGATATQELAFTLANALEYVRTALADGLNIDDFAPRLSFFFGIGMDFFMEIAKLRAARLLWVELMAQFAPQLPESSRLRTHCQTSGASLTQEEPYNNIVRATIEAMAAVLGGTQSLHTNSFDEALALPSAQAARTARNTQLILGEESGIPLVVDPLGGSFYVERLTADVAAAARSLIHEIEAIGGMTKAIELGIPQSRIEEAASRRQARVDNCEDIIVGVNKYCAVGPSLVDVREIDATHVRRQQTERLASVRAARDEGAVIRALAALREAASSGQGTLLDLSIGAMAVRSTVGEVSSALSDVFQRHQAGAYSLETVPSVETPDRRVPGIREKIARFAERKGRAPRILLTKLGQDGHDRGMKVLAGMFKAWGFGVDIAPLFSDATEIVRRAASKDVDVIGVSSHAGGHKALVAALNAALKAEGVEDIVLICGGIIPPSDGPALEALGVQAIYGPGTSVSEIAADILQLLEGRRLHVGEKFENDLASAT
ncbi:MAG TPA: methylmalonyl-CoA mutase [Methylovirgula sp.]